MTCLESLRYVFVLFIFTVLTETNILCRQMGVAGPEKGPEWIRTQDAMHLESLVCSTTATSGVTGGEGGEEKVQDAS